MLIVLFGFAQQSNYFFLSIKSFHLGHSKIHTLFESNHGMDYGSHLWHEQRRG